jgi:hypothetical protein
MITANVGHFPRQSSFLLLIDQLLLRLFSPHSSP